MYNKVSNLFIHVLWIVCESHSVMSNSLWPHGLYSPWNSPGQNTGMGSHSLLQGMFPSQGLNQGLPHCRWILYQLSHQGSSWILEWVAYPFSKGIFLTQESNRRLLHAGGFFTSWATREALIYVYLLFFRLFSHISHCRILSRVSCAMSTVCPY